MVCVRLAIQGKNVILEPSRHQPRAAQPHFETLMLLSDRFLGVGEPHHDFLVRDTRNTHDDGWKLIRIQLCFSNLFGFLRMKLLVSADSLRYIVSPEDAREPLGLVLAERSPAEEALALHGWLCSLPQSPGRKVFFFFF